MPTGIPLTYETMLTEISSTHCKIVLPGLSDDIKADRRFLKSRLGDFYDRCVRTRLRAPGNEKPDQVWTREGTGLNILPLERKTKKKRANVADYEIEYSINGSGWFNSGLCLERKRYEDFYNTVLFHYDRFMDELERFEEDPLLFRFRIIVEGSVEQVLNYSPLVPKICKCCNFCQPYHNNVKKIHNYYCTFEVLAGNAEKPKLMKPVSTCEFCVPHQKTEKEIEDIKNRLRAIIEDFDSMKYNISFYDSRETAMSFVKDIAKRHFISNYQVLMDL